MSEMIHVPDGWEVKALNNYTKLITKGTTPTTYGFNFHDNGINFIKAESIDEFGNIDVAGIQFIDEETNHFLKRSQLKQGDLLFSIAGVLGRVTILKKEDLPANTNQALAIIRLKENSERYLYYFLQSQFILSQIKSLNVQMAQANLSLENLNNFQIIIPKEKKEQEKIAKILSTLDKAIESTNRLIEKEKNIKTALMQELLTNGIDKDGHIRTRATHTYKESELGLIPDEWEIVSLEKLISKVIDFRGKTPLKIGMDWGNGLIPSLSANNVQMGKVDFSKETHFGSEELYNVWMNKGATQKDDILFTMEAPLGNVALIPDNNKYILSQRVILLRIGKKIISHYMYYYMMCDDFQTRMLKYSSGSTVKGIQYSRLKEIYIAFPKDIEEQKQIAKILTNQDKKIETEETNLAKLKELKKGLMNDLLSGKVRVKV
jgi:type I restriction enzyme S subunit